MARTQIEQRLFENGGAGPKIREDILPKSIPSGVICMWSGAVNAVPTDWALCDGQNGTPDLRDRFVVGAGRSKLPGKIGGWDNLNATVEATTLTTAQMPAHSHKLPSQVNVLATGNGWTATTGATMGSNTTQNTGGGGSHTHALTAIAESNLPPYYALAYIMKL